jgi:hypothetical protein
MHLFVKEFIRTRKSPMQASRSSMNTTYSEFVYLDSFRSQLRDVLAGYNLPSTLCDEDAEWFRFLTAYAGVIEDGELSAIGKPSQNLKAVEKVVFRQGQISGWRASHVPFSLRWDIHLLDGRICEAQLSADENARGISHHLSINGSPGPGIRWTKSKFLEDPQES